MRTRSCWTSPGTSGEAKALLSRTFAKFWWDTYDFLGLFLLANILSFFASLLVIPIPGIWAAFLYFASQITDEREPEFIDFWIGFKRYFLRSALLTLICLLVIGVLIVNILFYMNSAVVPSSLRIPAAIAAGLCFWAIILVLMILVYAYPIMVTQNVGLRQTLKSAALIVLDNPLYSFMVLIMLAGILVLAVLTCVGPVVFLYALSATLVNSAFDNVMKKYADRQAAQKAQERPQEQRRLTSWIQIKDEEERKKKHDRYKRSIREIFKPWEY